MSAPSSVSLFSVTFLDMGVSHTYAQTQCAHNCDCAMIAYLHVCPPNDSFPTRGILKLIHFNMHSLYK